MGWFDRMLEWLNFGRLADTFNDNRDFLMTKGLRFVAVMLVIVAFFYLYLAYQGLSGT